MGYRPHRYPTTFPVELLSGTTVHKCYMTNVTTMGAGIFDINGLEPLAKVKLRCSVGLMSATVQWIDDDQCGLKFDQWLSTRQLEQLRHSPTTHGPALRSVHAFAELR